MIIAKTIDNCTLVSDKKKNSYAYILVYPESSYKQGSFIIISAL
jgi:hypothetical protein